FLESDLLKLKPDIITILFSWNDHWAAASQIADRDQEFPPQILLEAQNFLGRFHFYRLMKKTLLSAVEKNPDSIFDRQNIVYRVGLDNFGLNLKEICERVREAGATPILLTSPIPSLEKYYPPGARSTLHAFHEKYNGVIRDVAAVYDIDLVDLAREFDMYDGLWDDAARDPIHFNARGHELAARLIADYIEKKIGP
ncbi:MAG: SGNH/GDSL hydrolase family protein, partial [candidate division Zixibacteria bacterium]|nr:SGNH/GDSL hydrolase family protein [candidate division Zixibacteria bacterium]